MAGFKHKILFLGAMLPLFWSSSYSQITAGKIVYERRTNLEKRFANSPMQEWLRGEKAKTELFDLYFNDTCSLFMPQPSDIVDRTSWATTKNVVYQAPQRDYRVTRYMFMMSEIFIEDSLKPRVWKMTGSRRNISGYDCHKAIWQKNDSTRIYAWYADEIIPSIGPESFVGLPGAILGLATEDGGVVYFAKTVEATNDDFSSKILPVDKKKLMTEAALREKFAKDFAQYPWAKDALNELFSW